MKNTKKFLSVLLATIMMLSIFTIGFTASAADAKSINRIDITYRTDISGLDYCQVDKIASTKPDSVSLQLFYDNEETVYYTEKLVAGEKYGFSISAYSDDYFVFASDLEIYINGQKIASDKYEIHHYTKDNGAPWSRVDIEVGEITITQRSFADSVIDFFDEIIASITPFFDVIVGFFASLIGGLFHG